MFESQLGLKENPFVAGHHPKFVYPSREHQEALAHLRYGIENTEPFVLITGEVGTGKTTAIYDALSGWKDRAIVALITNSRLKSEELLEEICLRFGVLVSGGVSKPHALVQLERHLTSIRARGDLAILLLDEAQNLERDQLEEIRLLSNLELSGQKLLQIFLVGQPELESKLGRPELRQLRQRIAIHYRISPLTPDETARYIHHRVTAAGGDASRLFPLDTCAEIHRLTHGIPREINTVAGQSLITAFVADSPSVLPAHVSSVVEDDEFHSVLDGRPAGSRGPAEPALTLPVAESRQPTAAAAAIDHPRAAAPPSEPARAAEPEAERPRAPRAEPLSIPPPTPGPAVLAWRMESAAVAPAAVRGGAAPASPVYTAPESSPPSSPRSSDDSIPRVAEEPKVNDQPKQPEGGEPPDVKMPQWLDEVLEKRKQVDAQVSADRARVGETGASGPPPAPSSAAKVAAGAAKSAPDRIAPHPTDPKPAGYTPSPYISPRLRDKLMSAGETEDIEIKSGGGGALKWIFGIGALAAVAVVAVLLIRAGGPKKSAAPPLVQEPAATATAPAGSDSAGMTGTPPATTATPPTGAAGASAGGAAAAGAGSAKAGGAATATPLTSSPGAAATAPGTTAPKPAAPITPRPATPTTGTASSKPTGAAATGSNKPAAGGTAAAAAPAPARKYGIEVGRYLNQERATSEKDRLAAATGLEGRVLTATEDGGEVYRVVLGSFDGRGPADRAAADLIGKGSVGQAVVVALPK